MGMKRRDIAKMMGCSTRYIYQAGRTFLDKTEAAPLLAERSSGFTTLAKARGSNNRQSLDNQERIASKLAPDPHQIGRAHV